MSTTRIKKDVENNKKLNDNKEQSILPFKVNDNEEYYVEKLGKIPKKPFYSTIKRFFDIFISFISLVVFCFPMLVIAIIVKCSSKGPVFYKQDRLGYKGKTFQLIKFRTMYVNSEKDGAQWSNGKNDVRITGFGKFLRNTRLDELPQLWTCFIGTMSLIGPRPERECFYNEFEKYVHGFNQRLLIKPGMTGLAQINGGYNLKPQEKIVYDIEYIKKRSIWLDIKILFKTVGVVFSHNGAK